MDIGEHVEYSLGERTTVSGVQCTPCNNDDDDDEDKEERRHCERTVMSSEQCTPCDDDNDDDDDDNEKDVFQANGRQCLVTSVKPVLLLMLVGDDDNMLQVDHQCTCDDDDDDDNDNDDVF